MSSSVQINELAAAMARAQGKLKNPSKDKLAKVRSERTGAVFEYAYADLAATLVCCREALSSEGIAIFQETVIKEEAVVLNTRLVHQSGQWIAAEYPVSKFAAPQTMGMALTYARKQSLSALAGLSGEDDDDDGTEASKGGKVEDERPVSAATRAYLDKALNQLPLIMTVKELIDWWRKEAAQRGKLGLTRNESGNFAPGYGELFEAYSARGRELGKAEETSDAPH